MINIDSILAGDNLYLYGGRINDKGVVKDVEAVNKAFEIAKGKFTNAINTKRKC